MRRHVALYLPRKDGSRLVEHYEAVAAHTGEMPDDAEFPEVPDAGITIWDWYFELRNAAGSGLNGAEAISYGEMAAWANIYGRTVLPIHDRFFRVLDAAYLNAVHAKRK